MLLPTPPIPPLPSYVTPLPNSVTVWETPAQEYWDIQLPRAEVPFVLNNPHMYFSFFTQNPSPDQQIESFTMVLNFVQISKPKKSN